MYRREITFKDDSSQFSVNVIEVMESRFRVNHGDPSMPNTYPVGHSLLLPMETARYLAGLWQKDTVIPSHLKGEYKQWLMDMEQYLLKKLPKLDVNI